MKKMLYGALFLSLFMNLVSAAAGEKVLNIGLVLDGESQRVLLPIATLQKEVRELLEDDYQVRFPENKQLHGHWSSEGSRAAIQKLLSDHSVDIVVTLGYQASHAAADFTKLNKPVIAAFVADVELQGFPLSEKTSGKRNFVYIYDFNDTQRNLAALQEIVLVKKLAVLIDPFWLQAIPNLDQAIGKLEKELGMSLTLAPVNGSVTDIMNALPVDADAVYVTPLLRLSDDDISALADQLIARGLPSFSEAGRQEVALGLLAGRAGRRHDEQRRARRIANTILRIMTGANAAQLKVGMDEGGRMAINMNTARGLSISPGWHVLSEAELIQAAAVDQGEALTLQSVMQQALRSNLELQSVQINSDIAEKNVGISRSVLLPQLSIAAGTDRIDKDRASSTGPAERNTNGSLSLSQILYSDSAWASHSISKLLRSSVNDQVKTTVLDTLQAAAQRYLNILRDDSRESVQRSNLDLTRKNLELAKLRQQVGISSRADVLRWQSQIATNQQDVLEAESVRLQSETELNRLLNRPVTSPVNTSDPGINSLLGFLDNPDIRRFFDSPQAWSGFQRYFLDQATNNAPELTQFNPLIAAQQRRIKSDRRAYYVPDVELTSRYERDIDRSGRAASLSGTGLDRNQWFVGIQASLPLYAGGGRSARLGRSRHQLRQLRLDQNASRERVEARMAAALQQVGGSYPGIVLSRQAADAATSNLALVTDQYSKGSVSITELIDAQNASLVAGLDASAAQYAFLIDFVEVLRASGDFDLLLKEDGIEQWQQRLNQYIRGGH